MKGAIFLVDASASIPRVYSVYKRLPQRLVPEEGGGRGGGEENVTWLGCRGCRL